jgi:hypothetical protein
MVGVAVGGCGVGVGGRRVGVAVAGRLVGVGGTCVCARVGVSTGVGVSGVTSVAVGDGSVSGVKVAVQVAVADGLGVLVGVGVTVGERATRESRGQVQLMVVITTTNNIPKVASLPLISFTLLFPPV